jgi:hypothetical protein
MWSKRVVFALSILLSACAADPSRFQVTPQSTKSLIVVGVRPTAIDYWISMGKYDAQLGKLTASPFDGWVSFEVPASTTAHFLTTQVDPGRYAFSSVAQQRAWVGCFHEHSLSFEVGPGEVVYLGVFDAAPHLAQIQHSRGPSTT